jgi:hypothetical protein
MEMFVFLTVSFVSSTVEKMKLKCPPTPSGQTGGVRPERQVSSLSSDLRV